MARGQVKCVTGFMSYETNEREQISSLFARRSRAGEEFEVVRVQRHLRRRSWRQQLIDCMEAIMRERHSNSRMVLRTTAFADKFTQSAS